VKYNGKAILEYLEVIRGWRDRLDDDLLFFVSTDRPENSGAACAGRSATGPVAEGGGLIPYDPYHGQQMCGITPDPEAQLSPIPPLARRLFV
jgi:hypothetical protein